MRPPIKIITLLVVSTLLIGASAVRQNSALPLAVHGPYGVGVITLEQVDLARDERVLITEVWYPAQPDLAVVFEPHRNANPLLGDGRFPLVVYAHGNYGHRTELVPVLQHLASYGYVVVAMDHDDREDAQWRGLIDRPQDILFALDHLPLVLPEDLGSIVNWDRVGVVGFSLGGFTAVAMSGAQFDPAAYLEACHRPAWRGSSACRYVEDWAEVAAYRAQFDALPTEGLWPPAEDERIQAIMAMSPSRSILFGEAGLAASETPLLIVHGVQDEWASYDTEALFLVDHLGGEPVVLLSILDATHYFPSEPAYEDVLRHFMVAWFNWQLAGEGDDLIDKAYFDSAALDLVPGWVLGEVGP